MDYLPREIRSRRGSGGDGRRRRHVVPIIPILGPEICVRPGEKNDCEPIRISQGLCRIKIQSDKKVSRSIHTR
jgi:hypothetical protein